MATVLVIAAEMTRNTAQPERTPPTSVGVPVVPVPVAPVVVTRQPAPHGAYVTECRVCSARRL